MSWNCTQAEEHLTDFLDGALAESERRRFEEHVDSCPRCAPLLAQVTHVLGRLHTLEPAPAPAHLVSHILDQTLGPRKTKRSLREWLPVIWQPRVGMGLATVAPTVLLLFRLTGVRPSQIQLADLSPVNIYRSADIQAHRVFARSVKFVNDLRVVYEIQSRLQPANAQPPVQQESAPAQPQPQPQPKSQHDSEQGHSSRERFALLTASADSGNPVASAAFLSAGFDLMPGGRTR